MTESRQARISRRWSLRRQSTVDSRQEALSRPARLSLWLFLVLGTWLPLQGRLSSRGEAFWLLFPLWVMAGALLRVLPLPRQPGKSRAARAAVIAVLLLFPSGFYLAMVRLQGGSFSFKEWLLAVYFFALSLELFLLYFFQAVEGLLRWITRGRGAGVRLGATLGIKTGLYLLLFPFLLSTFSLHRVKVPPGPSDPELELRAEEVSFPSHGPRPLALRGSFFPLKKPRGTVLACHGVAANRADILGIAALLHDAGFQVLTFDFRGHGESEGHTVTYGYREREDVLGAWDYLLSRPDVDGERVFAYGLSMGAASLILALPEMPRARAAVLDSAFADLPSMVGYQYRFLPGLLARPLAGLTSFFAWLETGVEVDQVSPLAALERVRAPLFFLHGTEDRVIPCSSTERLHQAYRGPKRLRLAQGASHGGTVAQDPLRYSEEIRSFFLEAIP